MAQFIGESDPKIRLELLHAQRVVLEMEADAIHNELTSPGLEGQPPAGVKDALVDAEGFPRHDIDIYNVKRKRKRLAEINTDYKALMKQIEAMLQQYHMYLEDAVVSLPQVSSSNVSKPIAKLDEIVANSPAFVAGIMESDLLIRFGTIDSSTENALSKVAALVGGSVDKRLPIVVQREGELISLVIVPSVWGGRGLLGCHLSLLK